MTVGGNPALPAVLDATVFTIPTSAAAEATDRPGVATGLVWTPVGGDIVFIEASKMPGCKTLTITGQLGEVMR